MAPGAPGTGVSARGRRPGLSTPYLPPRLRVPGCGSPGYSVLLTRAAAFPGSPRKVVEKAKNNYFCSMETGYELFLPEGILTYFEVTHADRTATAILIYLDEKDLSEEERSGKHLQSKGFYPPASIHDFPLRGKSLILHVRRRRWVDLDTGNPYMRAWEVVAKGTRLTEEFASFLKGTPG